MQEFTIYKHTWFSMEQDIIYFGYLMLDFMQEVRIYISTQKLMDQEEENVNEYSLVNNVFFIIWILNLEHNGYSEHEEYTDDITFYHNCFSIIIIPGYITAVTASI